MSKLNQIERTLKEIDATKFHKLINTYLHKKYGYPLHSTGTKIAEDKPIKGTPDSLIALPNKNYIFIEITTQKTNIIPKFTEDIQKCLNPKKAGIPLKKIERIILACNSNLSAKQIETLQQICKEIPCDIITNSTLSLELFNTYSILAKEMLNVEIDTGQILDDNDFIQTYDASRYATTPLDTTFQFRTQEKKEILENLQDKNIILISGQAGVGKTKLALECCASYAKEHAYTFKAIFNKKVDIYDDIRSYFTTDKKFIIFIDDINRIKSAFNYIYDTYPQKIKAGDIKLVLSIRDYALDCMKNTLNNISYHELPLQKFTNEEIQELIKTEYGILNHHYHERIIALADGNPRLALMLAKIAKEKNTLTSIQNVANIYNNYFSHISNELNLTQSTFKSIAIIVFFGAVDKSNEKQMRLIKELFYLDEEAFWAEIENLHQHEICDLYENEVVKISDQVLATYLFYHTVFKEKTLSIDIFLEHLFIPYSHRMKDTLIPILRDFGTKDIKEAITPSIKKLFKTHHDNSLEKHLIMKTFFYIIPDQTLLYCKQYIDAQADKTIDIDTFELEEKRSSDYHTDNIIEILQKLRFDKERFHIALELLLKYFDKDPIKLGKETLTTLTAGFGYWVDSHYDDYTFETTLLEMLWAKTDTKKNPLFSKLYLAVLPYYLALEHSTGNQRQSTNQSTHYINYPLEPSSPLLSMRKSMWLHLFDFYQDVHYHDKVLNVIVQYISSIEFLHSDSGKILASDATFLLDFFKENLSPNLYYHCKIVQEYISILETHGIYHDSALKETFTNPTYTLSKIMLLDDSNFYEEDSSLDEILLLIDKKIHQELQNYQTDANLKLLITQCRDIHTYVSNPYAIEGNFRRTFEILFKQNSKRFLAYIECYINLGMPIINASSIILPKLIKLLGKEQTLAFIHTNISTDKEVWIFEFYHSMPKENIHEQDVINLLQHYHDSTTPPHLNLIYLLKYFPFQKDFLVKLSAILFEKSKNDEAFLSSLYNLFNFMNKELFSHFNKETPLLEEIYLLLENRYKNQHFDYSCELLHFILDKDSDFIKRYISSQFDNAGKDFLSKFDNHRNMMTLWERKDYQNIMNSIFETIWKKSDNYHFSNDYFSSFFSKNYGDTEIEIDTKQKTFIFEMIKNHQHNQKKINFLFNLIAEFDQQTNQESIALFLSLNQNFEDFKQLNLEPSYHSYSDSVVYYSEKKRFYESLLGLCTGIVYLEHKEHIQKGITHYEEIIKDEKKRNFLSN